MRCVCGCDGRVLPYPHHVIYQQHLRSAAKRLCVPARRLLDDPRNLVPITFDCHGRHHSGARRFELAQLPDSVFEFAAEVLGAGPGYEYLRRRYAGEDPRLDALIVEEVA